MLQKSDQTLLPHETFSDKPLLHPSTKLIHLMQTLTSYSSQKFWRVYQVNYFQHVDLTQHKHKPKIDSIVIFKFFFTVAEIDSYVQVFIFLLI